MEKPLSDLVHFRTTSHTLFSSLITIVKNDSFTGVSKEGYQLPGLIIVNNELWSLIIESRREIINLPGKGQV